MNARRIFFRRLTVSTLLATGFLSVTGCSQQTLNSAQNDAQHNANIVQREAKRAERKAKPQLDKLSLGARVTTAIAANENLRGTHIRADADTDGVKLRGTVKTGAQKTLAGRVAEDTLGPDKTVSNELKVTGE